MNKCVWKYSLHQAYGGAHLSFAMPVGANLLAVRTQGKGDTCLWILADARPIEYEERTFTVYHTGYEFSADGKEYVGTVYHGDAVGVYHVFEVKQQRGTNESFSSSTARPHR